MVFCSVTLIVKGVYFTLYKKKNPDHTSFPNQTRTHINQPCKAALNQILLFLADVHQIWIVAKHCSH